MDELKEQLEIAIAEDLLKKRVEGISILIGTLEERLQPIISNNIPTSDNKPEATNKRVVCLLAENIFSVCDRLGSMEANLNLILKTIQI